MLKKFSIALAAALGISLAGGAAQAQTFDISGTNSWDFQGDADNEILTLDIADALGLGSGSAVNLFGVGWDVTIETLGGSWLNEADIQITDTNDNVLFDFNPGNLAESGTGTFVGNQFQFTPVFLADGLVNVEFYQTFNSFENGIDTIYLDTSTLTFYDQLPITQTQTFDISGTNSWDSLGDPDNEVLTLDIADALGLGSGSAVNLFGVGWDVTIMTDGSLSDGDGSWFSEAEIRITDTSGNVLFDFDAGTGEFPGTDTFVGGEFQLTPVGSEFQFTPAFLADGLVNVEFYESFDDATDVIDATYLATSTLTFQIEPVDVPEPAFLLGFVLLGGELYRRKRTN
ncbi:hypothetical protein [Dapis sp. BLCC M229]|uniref:hypothetical protein n=1 Tax=Dapis sp. BLCC M229 TaxID=3400188 RepID=UPI003CE6C0B0